MSRRTWQLVLLIGAIASLVLVIVVLLQVILSPYVHGGPARVTRVNAGSYPLKITFYADPANAGYTLPFAIQAETGGLTYDVSVIPGKGTVASIVHGDVYAGTTTADGIPGSVNVTERGSWIFHVTVNGPAGKGEANVAFNASAPPAIPSWLAWLIGFLPMYGIVLFLLARRRNNQKESDQGKQEGLKPASVERPERLIGASVRLFPIGRAKPWKTGD